MKNKKILVTGAGGFIGGHMVKTLLDLGNTIRAVDIKETKEWFQIHNCENISADCRLKDVCDEIVKDCDIVLNFSCDMGGIGYIHSNKLDCLTNVLINVHLMQSCIKNKIDRYFYSSSACIYNTQLQKDKTSKPLSEKDAFPAMPEDGYGWEKLFSELYCLQVGAETGIKVRIARYHNIYGPNGTYDGGREKAPAAIARKISYAKLNNLKNIEIWGNGEQKRSFLYIDDCIDATIKLINSEVSVPINIGSEKAITINELVDLTAKIGLLSDYKKIYNLNGTVGVNVRNCDLTLCKTLLGWEPKVDIKSGLTSTFNWIHSQLITQKN